MRVPITELARRRVAVGMAQRELAERIGVAPGTLSSIENGWRVPWPKLRAACAEELGVSETELFPSTERGVREAVFAS